MPAAAPLRLVPSPPPEDADDRALARLAAQGDERAFERIYARHSGRVYALCLRMTGSAARAADFAQDTFVQVWQQIGTWRGESALGSWIHRIAVNVVLGQLRTEQRRAKHEEPGGGGALPDGVVKPVAVHDAMDLERAIAALPPGARTVFVLHDVEGYKHDEIAALMGTAVGTCRAQLHRARQLLMEALER